MHFLYPAFLFALVSLAIPVLVHLFNFRRYKKVMFSNVQFLQHLQEQQASRRNLRERLILAARLLALFFLVAAFAQPYWGKTTTNGPTATQAVSIFLDNSYSMQNLAREGTLLDEAKQKAKAIANAYGINDRFQLITQDFKGEHQRLLTQSEFDEQVDKVQLSAQSRSIAQIAGRQASLFNNTSQRGPLYILSDMQTNLFDKNDKQIDSTTINFIKLNAAVLPNIAVDTAWFTGAVYRPGDNVKMVVTLHNYADKPAQNIPVKVTINGAQKAIASYTIAPRKTVTDTLQFSGLTAGWQKGIIELQDNPVTFDNSYYFAFSIDKNLPVLLISDGQPNRFVAAAFATDPFFKTTFNSSGNINYQALASYPVIALTDVNNLSIGLASQLASNVRSGQTLIVFPGQNINMATYGSFLQKMGLPYPEKLNNIPQKVNGINTHNAVFSNIFESAPQNPELPQANQWYAYHNGQSNGESILSMPGNQLYLSSFKVGAGTIFLSAVALSDDFGNFQRHGLFVPLLYRMALLSGRQLPLSYTLGNQQSIESILFTAGEKEQITLTHKQQNIIPDVRTADGRTSLFLSDQLTQSGHYTLKKNDSTLAILAFNDNRSESDLSYFDVKTIRQRFNNNKISFTDDKKPLNKALNDANNGTHLWKLCIILALIFLAIEIALVRLLKTDGVSGQSISAT